MSEYPQYTLGEFNSTKRRVCVCRRRSESRADHVRSYEANTTIIYLAPRPVRLFAVKGKTRMGPEAGETGGQLCSERVCYMGEAH